MYIFNIHHEGQNRYASILSDLDVHLDGKLASIPLVIPLFDPVNGAQRSERLEEDLARFKVFALDVDTLVVVDVRLEAVLGLVLVREPGVKLGGFELEVFLVNFNHGGSWGDEL